MKARFRESAVTSGGFEAREILRSAAFSGEIGVFASTSETAFFVCNKDGP
jgi:hypothetical protein